MPFGWYGLVCCICWKQLTEEMCVVDALGDKVDCCPGKCASSAGVITGPVNIYVFGQLLWEEEQYARIARENKKANGDEKAEFTEYDD